MKSLLQYIKEADESDEINQDALDDDRPTSDDNKPSQKELTRRGNIKFTIWKEPKVKVNWLEDNEDYQKIEYQYRDKKKKINIDFLLGYVNDEKTWKLWIGKIGAINYDDDPWCDFETDKFSEAIIAALDKVEEMIDDVEKNPDNWVQFYIS